jgi:hypothetical protein
MAGGLNGGYSGPARHARLAPSPSARAALVADKSPRFLTPCAFSRTTASSSACGYSVQVPVAVPVAVPPF